jgi:phage gp36-like protein
MSGTGTGSRAVGSVGGLAGAYCTLDDIKKTLPEAAIIQLTDDDDLGYLDEIKVNEAIAAADAEIDTYCAARYTVPFETAPAQIKKLSIDIAIYNLYKRKVETVPEAKKDSYNNAVRMLKDISAGKAALMVGTEEVADLGGPESTTSVDDKIFTKTRLDNF